MCRRPRLFMKFACMLPILLGGFFALGCNTSGGLAGGESEDADGSIKEGSVYSGPVRETVGDLHLEYFHGSGLHLSAFGLPILRGSSIVAVNPGWTEVYYNSRQNMTLLNRYRVEDYQGGRRITIDHDLAEEYGSAFNARKTITLYPDNRCEVRLDFRFDGAEPPSLEWRAGGVNPALLAGVPVRVVDHDEIHEAVVPFEAPGPEVEESTVALGFEQLEIASRIGAIGIESAAGDSMILFDYRKNRHADQANPMFWLGYLQRAIPSESETSYQFTLQLPGELQPVGETVETVRARIPVNPVETARLPPPPRDFIIPAPKEINLTGGGMPLNSETALYVGADPGKGIETAVAFLMRDLKEFYDLEPNVVREDPPARLPDNAIILGETGRFAAPAESLGESGLELPEHREGYVLQVGDDRTLIAARTEQGVFYGVTTLLQLIAPGPDGVILRGADIVDYPSLDFRGVHALTGKDAGSQISDAVRDLMARYKMNSFVWQCGYMIWDAAPEIAHPVYGMEKEDARQVVATADEYFVDLIPLIPSLGHVRWMFTNDQNLDLAEDPETPHAYTVTNPRTYEFIFSIFQEAVDFFQPSGFHIGHDEVDMWGRFPYRSADSGLSATDLIIKDTVKLNDWFRERDISVYMWGDMYLYRDEAPDATFAPSLEEAGLRRSLLPNDIIITDWHYATVPPEEFTSIPIWMEEGFTTIGAAWWNPLNIRNLALAGIQQGAEGFLQTTWAGHNFAINDHESEWRQYWAYLIAAHYAWSGDQRMPEELPFVPRDEFVQTWFRTPPVIDTEKGFQLDLKPVFNRSLNDPDGSGWLGYGPENDFRSLPGGEQPLGETVFRIGDQPEDPGALLMAGQFNPEGVFPETVTLEIDPRAASQLHFLMTASHRTDERRRVATIKVTYTDGSTEAMQLRYGQEIFAFDQDRLGRHARIVWEGESGAGTQLRLWDLTWSNPYPEKEIEAIRIHSSITEASPILLAITGVE